MRSEDRQAALDALDDLLDAERAALLQGNLDDLVRLSTRKAALIDALNRMEFDTRAPLEHLYDKVARNQVLLDSALDGIRSVARRLAAIRRVRQSLDTYDSTGRKQTVDLGSIGSVEKRA